MSETLTPSQEAIKAELVALAKETAELRAMLEDVVKKSLPLYEQQRSLKIRLAKNEEREKKLKVEMMTMTYEMAIEEVRWFPGFDLVTDKELRVLYDRQDRTRYASVYGFLDWPYLVLELISTRQMYPTWRLTALEQGLQVETLPPYTSYRFVYTDTATRKEIICSERVRDTRKAELKRLLKERTPTA